MIDLLPSPRRALTRPPRFAFRPRHLLGLVALFVCLSTSISCKQAEKPDVPSGGREEIRAVDPDEVLIASLQEVDGIWRQEGGAEPFTGRAVERYRDGKLAVQSDYDQGVIQSKVQWVKRGTKKSETKYRDGEAHFETLWRGSDGSKKIESEIKDGIPHGSHKRWHSNGQLTWEGEFYEGKWHGLVEDRDADGNLIIKGRYDKGVLVEDLLEEK